MNPEDFNEASEALSAAAGMLWAVYSRLIAEGASPAEAAILASTFTASMIQGSQAGSS